VQRDFGRDGDVAPDADEVDVHEVAPGGVALDLAGEREVLVTVDLEVDQGVRPGLAGEDVAELAGGHGDGDGITTEAVHDGGHEALTTDATGRPGSEIGARSGFELDVCHDGFLTCGATAAPRDQQV
jgi:hypothetical protein